MIYLKDYSVPEFLVDRVFLHFDLLEDKTNVKSVLHMRHNPVAQGNQSLNLDGEGLALLSILLDGKPLTEKDYSVDAHQLIVHAVKGKKEKFILEIEVTLKPQENFSGNGLFQSKGNYCTQCESHGFRCITYFPDRPDVLSLFTTTITADKKSYPILLSNGNLVGHKELENGRHWVKWEDPSLKPSYLFALVAGDYDCLEDEFITCSGRKVDLKLYVEKGNLSQSAYAMECLKRAMKWDEEKFGREYDLDIYMIVAVSTFNMGAMENKGLNIFNDKYILAKPDTATDSDYIAIEAVIGHEYFHNWSGNRVTVRDWFQITLKEGLTIFRDQNFTADMTSHAVKRIEDANLIRTQQFAQDAGPMSHPIRPDHYMEVNNFYTVTVYHKGAEVIRMLQTLLGNDKFSEGMNFYFTHNDGKAVTTEDFVYAMEKVSGLDLTQFKRWYSQAGTPILTITDHYEEATHSYSITVKQSCPPTPDQPNKQPFYLPLAVGLLSDSGEDLLPEKTKILIIDKEQQTFKFENIPHSPIPSLLRNFSAPVKLEYDYSFDELLFLMQHDSDPYNQWSAAQELGKKIIYQLVALHRDNQPLVCGTSITQVISAILKNNKLDTNFLAELITLPSEIYLIESMESPKIDSIYVARKWLKTNIGNDLREEFSEIYHRLHEKAYRQTKEAYGKRALKNVILSYLVLRNEPPYFELAEQQYHYADNMTDKMGALLALNQFDNTLRQELLDDFYRVWKNENLVLNKWLSLHAMAPITGVLSKVKELMRHPAFDIKNPNKVRALIETFCRQNPINFHAKEGSGYQFLAEQVVTIDKFNPQVAARILEPLTRFKKYDEKRQALMKRQLEWISTSGKLSKDVQELVVKSLQSI